VVLLSDDIDEVIYVAWGPSMCACAESAAHRAAAAAANHLRWYRTADEAGARTVGKAMVRRFKPDGNRDDSQWGVAPV